jgi:hypothetical protein
MSFIKRRNKSRAYWCAARPFAGPGGHTAVALVQTSMSGALRSSIMGA